MNFGQPYSYEPDPFYVGMVDAPPEMVAPRIVHAGFGTSSMSGARSSGWTSTLVLAGVVGLGVAGYLLYRQFYVSAGTVRGIKRALGGEGA